MSAMRSRTASSRSRWRAVKAYATSQNQLPMPQPHHEDAGVALVSRYRVPLPFRWAGRPLKPTGIPFGRRKKPFFEERDPLAHAQLAKPRARGKGVPDDPDPADHDR